MQLGVVLWDGSIGGAELATLTLARSLAARGTRVTGLFVGEPGVVGRRFLDAGLDTATLDATPGSRILFAPRRAAEILRRVAPDGAVLVSGGVLALAFRLGGYRGSLVAVEHGALAQLERMDTIRQMRSIANWTSGARLVDAFVGVSQFMVGHVQQHAPGCRVRHIPNGIDTSAFAPCHSTGTGHSPIVIGCAGRLIDGKGFEDVINAAAVVARRVPLHLRIAGDGPRRDELSRLAASLSPSLRVTIEGWCSSMVDFWNGCDFAVVPSRDWIEAFGMTALEALACGRTVIASDSGGLPEVVDDQVCGIVYPKGDIAALADAIELLASDQERRDGMGKQGRERAVQRFEAQTIAQRYSALFEELAAYDRH